MISREIINKLDKLLGTPGNYKLLFYSLLLLVCSVLFYGWKDGLFTFIQICGAISTVAFGVLLIGCALKKIRSRDALLMGSGIVSAVCLVLLFTVFAAQPLWLFYIMSATLVSIAAMIFLLYRWL